MVTVGTKYRVKRQGIIHIRDVEYFLRKNCVIECTAVPADSNDTYAVWEFKLLEGVLEGGDTGVVSGDGQQITAKMNIWSADIEPIQTDQPIPSE